MKTLITDSIVFHGGIAPVIVPKCDYSRDNCDFGQGFYETKAGMLGNSLPRWLTHAVNAP